MNRIAVVGASAGGLATSEALRRLGYDGELTLIGEEEHLPYDRPPLSKQILSGEWGIEKLPLRAREDIESLKLDLRLGVRANGVEVEGRSVRLANGDAVDYDALVIATGVRPRRLLGSEGVSGVHVLRTLEDAVALKQRLVVGRRLVVVGAGFIGAEAAAVARGLGLEVTMLEPAPVPLAHAVGPEVGRALTQAHFDNGVDLRTGVMVQEILSSEGRVTAVQLADGSLIPADDVVVGIGSLPNVEWMQDSGLPLDNGLVCDEFSEAVPGVYGVGDVARWYNPLFDAHMRIEHRTNAAEQGMAVARNLLNPDGRRPFAPVPYFWSDQYDMKIQAYGYLRGHEEVAVVDGDLEARRFVALYRTGDRLAGVLSVGMPPKVIRTWRAAIAARSPWTDAIGGAVAA
ncbi:NAD(P)/FAD-dependent oxidoreductase [Streptomyces sp. NPDC096311]|uniref:NAD(P)/FAD-dependent oxidoreductase n=1 Tax=Streptomyces sp. NPDC096311 TaxID=3366083 RepID=UPI0037FD71AF